MPDTSGGAHGFDFDDAVETHSAEGFDGAFGYPSTGFELTPVREETRDALVTPPHTVRAGGGLDAARGRSVRNHATAGPADTGGRRGQNLARLSLLGGVVGPVIMGVSVFAALNGFELSDLHLGGHPWEVFADWGTVGLVGFCLSVLALAGGIVSEVRARPRLLATLAILSALVLPVIALAVGFKFGVDALAQHVEDATRDLGLTAGSALQKQLHAAGVPIGPIWMLILRFLS